jgi:hypothetical protein
MENLDQTYKRLVQENSKVDEALKGKQKKLDKNHNGKLDGQDFAILRNKKVDEMTKDEPSAGRDIGSQTGTGTDRAAKPISARNLARSALNKHLNKTYDAYNPDKDKLKKQHFGMAEEVESIDELSKGTLGNYVKKASRDATITRKIGADFENRADRARSPGMKDSNTELSSKYKQKSWKRRDGLEKAVDRLTKEEVNEAFINGREYASHGLMHPDHANTPLHKVTGKTIDFYAHGTGDKVQGTVVYHDQDRVHIRDTKGKKHEFKISKDLPKQTNEEADGVKTHAPVAPVPPKKKEPMKSRVGHPTNMKEEVEQLDEKIYADDYHSTSETSQFGGHRPHVVSKDTGKTMFLGQHSYKTPKHAIEHAQAYLHGYAKTGMHGADRASQAYSTANKHHLHMNEEVELAEANHRDFASQGKMHPDMAKHMTVGSHMDYYEPETGDKVHGKVMHKSDTEVHMKQTHDSYDPKKKGTVHKFAVTSKLDEQIDEVLKPSMGAASYINDFVHSKNPKFAGKSKETRKQMALAAYYAAKKGVKEETEQIDEKDSHEYADGEMTIHELKQIAAHSGWILEMLKPDTDLPEWVQAKITLAADYLSTACDYLHVEMNESTTDSDKYTIAEDNVDEAWVLRQKKKDKKTVKEESVKTFKDFLAGINEVKLADLPVRRIKGHSYGNQPEDHDDEDEEDNKPAVKKPEPTEKRGRGRPAGAKSGAKQIGSAPKQKSGVDYSGYKLHLPNSNR